MTDLSNAIKDAVETELRSNAAVKAEFPSATTRLYTLSAPNGAPFPHIIIGQDQIIGDDTECAVESEVIVTVHVYARQDTPTATRTKANSIAGAVRKALTKKLTLSGHVMDDWSFDNTIPLTEPDGLTAHSVVTFTYLTTAEA